MTSWSHYFTESCDLIKNKHQGKICCFQHTVVSIIAVVYQLLVSHSQLWLNTLGLLWKPRTLCETHFLNNNSTKWLFYYLYPTRLKTQTNCRQYIVQGQYFLFTTNFTAISSVTGACWFVVQISHIKLQWCHTVGHEYHIQFIASNYEFFPSHLLVFNDIWIWSFQLDLCAWGLL